jgi:hypothetical protein
VIGVRATAALWALAMAASAIVGVHGIAYWDAGDYVRLAIDGGQSGMLLGRPIFLVVSRMVLAGGVDPAAAEPVLRWFWSAVAATAAPLIAILAVQLGLSRAAALAVGAALALSPSFAHTSHQVLTDGAALALSIAALVAAVRSRAVLAGLLLGVAILTRETAAVHAVAVALLLGRRAMMAAGVAMAVVAATLWMLPPPAFDAWLQAMSRSIDAHPIGLWEVTAPFLWVLAAGPLPVVAGMVLLARQRPAGRWLVVSVPAAIGTIAILFYPDGSFSPRYMVATVPLAFFLPAGAWLAERPRVLAAALIAPLVVLFVVMRPARAVAARGAEVMERIARVPPNALVVPGHYCSQARLGATIHGRRDLEFMCPGWDWPPNPEGRLDAALAAGRPIAADVADAAWMPSREAQNRDTVRAWAAGRRGRDVAGFFVVE